MSYCKLAYNLVAKGRKVYAAVRFAMSYSEIAYNLVPKGRRIYAAVRFRGALF